jgi:hypothetical protein
MFEIDDETTSIEKEWVDSKGVSLAQHNKALKEFNNFLYIFKNYTALTNRNIFIFGKYRVIDYPRDTYKQMSIEYLSKKLFKKTWKKLITIYYDFAAMSQPSQRVKDYPYCIINMNHYNPKDNATYEMLFNALKAEYQVEMAANTEKLRIGSAFSELSLK